MDAARFSRHLFLAFAGDGGLESPALTLVQLLFYIRLISLTAGTLVYLFLLALILGHRRPRSFERLLFFVCLCLFMIYSGWLLEINSVIEYRAVPEVTRRFYWFLQFGGVSFLAAFLVHAHIAYLRDIASRRIPRWWGLVAGLFYAAPVVGCAATGLYARRHGPPLGLPDMVLGLGFFGVLLLVPALLISVTADISLFMRASGPTERKFFGLLAFISAMVLGSIAITNIGDIFRPEVFHAGSVAMIVLGVLPGGLLLYFVVWRNFLEYGAQRNLMYALPATFLALVVFGAGAAGQRMAGAGFAAGGYSECVAVCADFSV